MSLRPAPCIALSLPGSSGAGAFGEVERDEISDGSSSRAIASRARSRRRRRPGRCIALRRTVDCGMRAPCNGQHAAPRDDCARHSGGRLHGPHPSDTPRSLVLDPPSRDVRRLRALRCRACRAPARCAAGLVPAALEFARDARRWRCIASRAPSASCAASAVDDRLVVGQRLLRAAPACGNAPRCASTARRAAGPTGPPTTSASAPLPRGLGDQHVERRGRRRRAARNRRRARACARSSRAAPRYPASVTLRAASAAISPSISARAASSSNGPAPPSSHRRRAGVALALRSGMR